MSKYIDQNQADRSDRRLQACAMTALSIESSIMRKVLIERMRYLLDTLTFKSNQNELTTHQRFKSYLNAALGMQHEAKFEYEVQYN